MDRFELNWPDVDAQLLTDGWRCRIVWRQRGRHHGGGMGGTIDNNLQCVRRLAESLDGTPYLLGALRSRGHDRLAEQIASAAGPTPALPAAAESRAEPGAPEVDPVTAWLDALEGDDAHEAAANRRAKSWIELGELSGEALQLKAPAPKGRPEWVLKRTRPDDAKRKADYVAAGDFKGIAAWLAHAGADAAFVEAVFHATAKVKSDDLKAAAATWRRVQGKATH